VSSEQTVDDLLSRWHQLRQAGQAVTVGDLCADCPEKVEEVRQRLQAVASMLSFLDCTGVSGGGASQTGSTTADGGRPGPGGGEARPAPVNVPGYEILGELGRGGMGVVYKARQLGLKRLVALKMILAGAHAGPARLARFRAEAEAVARLQHPNIVQIHEIGEHDGLPFFSLELVDGGSLDKNLAGTPLPPRRAAELAETLARAVHVAHAHGIIHRDLKPANILLSRKNQEPRTKNQEPGPPDLDLGSWFFSPKVSDFGLAKRLDDDSATRTGAVLGTPSYMSPEQAAGKTEEIGPPADIYGLGAILYETLTGRPPFKAASVVDTLEQVRSAEPVPPSRLQPKVPRDLETVCLKCLQKDPRKRYVSALDLADDLRRFLDGRPIKARPVGLAERAWRWCRRNTGVAVLSAVLLLVVLGSLVALTALWLRADADRGLAEEAHDLAERRAADARTQQGVAEEKTKLAKDEAARATREAAKATKIAQTLAGLFEASDPLGLNGAPMLAVTTGETLTARKLLDLGVERLAGGLKGEPEVRARLLDTLGGVYCTLGEREKARPLLEEALAIHRRTLPADHAELAGTLHNLGWLYHQAGDYTRAEKYYRQALAIRRRHAAADPMPLSTTLLTLAWLLTDQEDFEAAERLFREVIELRRRHLGDGHRDVAVARAALAAMYINEGKFQAAVAPSLQAVAVLRKSDGNKSLAEAVGLFQKALLARELPPLARQVFGVGSARDAERDLRRCLDLTRKILGDRHPYTGLVLHELAVLLERSGKDDEAERRYRECLEVVRGCGLAHPKALILVQNYAGLLSRRGKHAEAERLVQETVEANRARYGPRHHLVADALMAQAGLLNRPGETGRREQLLREALAVYRQTPGRPRRSMTACLNRLAVCLGSARAKEAERLLVEAVPLGRKQLGRGHPFVALLLCNLASFRLDQGKHEGVEAGLREALATLRQDQGRHAFTIRRAWQDLGRFYRQTGRAADAADAALERRKLSAGNPAELYDVARDLAACAGLPKVADAERRRFESLALETLRQAHARGFADLRRLETDEALDPLRSRQEYLALVEEVGGAPGR
jgi:tetratricopeptide (TPR) repeat protein